MKRTVALLLILAAACGGDSTGPSDVAGTYDLQTVSGAPLPYSVPGQGANITEILSDQLVLKNGAVGEHGTWRTSTSSGISVFPVSDTGSYSPNGGAATLHLTNQGVTGTVASGRITYTQFGATFVYVKE